MCNKGLFIKIHEWRRTTQFADVLPTTRGNFCRVSFVCKQVLWYLKEGGVESLSISQNTKESRNGLCWASPVVQRLRVHLWMQGTWVQSLAWEDSTCHGTVEPGYHKYWRLSALELVLPAREVTAMRSPHTATREYPYTAWPEKAHMEEPNTQHSWR